MEEDWVWQLEVDVEAQKRELERLEQARCDRLVAEEMQGEIPHVPIEGEVKSDFPVGDAVDIDVQHVLLMSMGPPSSSLTTWAAPSDPSTTRHSISNVTPHQNISQCPEDNIISHLPRDSQQCWEAIEKDYVTPPTSPPLTRLPPPATDITPSPHPPPPSHHSFFLPLTSTPPSADIPFEGLDDSSCFESDKKLAEQIQQQEQEEQERREKLSSLDHTLAMELTREETAGEVGSERGDSVIERVKREVELFSQSKSDAEIARALQEEEHVVQQSGKEGGGGGLELFSQSKSDAEIARVLQEEEHVVQQFGKEGGGGGCEGDEQLARALQNEHSEADTGCDEEIARRLSTQFESTTHGPSTSTQLLASQPNWWSPCPNCPPNCSCKYHLIEISRDSSEWQQVTTPFTDVGFTPHRLQRVQNIKLYQRLEFEKQTMQMDRENGYQVKEALLFHTTSAAVSVICSEGLDQRLSRKGRFGSGVYFSDNPRKCDSYCKTSGTKTMFACHVLLGRILEYPNKKTDPSLLREPPGYDSVKGNVTGQDEYVIYTNYRAMPAYVIEYQ